MATRVAGRVDGPDTDAPQVEDVAVGVATGVRTRDEVEAIDHDAGEVGTRRTLEAVDLHEAVERSHAGEIGLGQMPGRGRVEMVPGDVVLVAMAVEHAVRTRRAPRSPDECERGVDHRGLVAAGDEQRAALRVLAAAGTADERDVRAERPIRLGHRVTAMSSMMCPSGSCTHICPDAPASSTWRPCACNRSAVAR